MPAIRDNKRPRGYMPNWTPRPHVSVLLGQTLEIISQYQEYGAMTCRQIFYRLVGQYDYPKDERAYARLCEALVKGRRAQIIPFSAIRDDPEESHLTGGYTSPEQWWRGQLYMAKNYRRDPREGQQLRVELWCEAAGMAPMLAQMVRGYGVDVYSTGGFSSVTVTHAIAQRVIEEAQEENRPTLFLHVGDYDPSGESIFDHMSEDVAAFVAADGQGDEFDAQRLALTAEQVAAYDLPTAPPKKSDSRSRSWVGQTCQLEAMDPKTLDRVVTTAISSVLDLGELERIREVEKVERDQLVTDVRERMGD